MCSSLMLYGFAGYLLFIPSIVQLSFSQVTLYLNQISEHRHYFDCLHLTKILPCHNELDSSTEPYRPVYLKDKALRFTAWCKQPGLKERSQYSLIR